MKRHRDRRLRSSATQVLCGMFPIAHVREPYTPIGFLAARLQLPKLLDVTHPDDASLTPVSGAWSAWTLCEGEWVEKLVAHTLWLTSSLCGQPGRTSGATTLQRLHGWMCIALQTAFFASRPTGA